MLNMYCLRSTPTAPPLVVFTDWQPASSIAALSTLTANDFFINTLPGNLARIVGGRVYLRQIHKTCNHQLSDTSHTPTAEAGHPVQGLAVCGGVEAGESNLQPQGLSRRQ